MQEEPTTRRTERPRHRRTRPQVEPGGADDNSGDWRWLSRPRWLTASREAHLRKLWWVLAVGALVALSYGVVAQLRGPGTAASAPQLPTRQDLGVDGAPTPEPAALPSPYGTPSRRSPSPTASRPSPSAGRTSSASGSPTPPASPLHQPPPSPLGAITGINALCVDVRSGAQSDGTTVQVLGCTGQASQQWEVDADGTLRAFGKCLTVSDHTSGGQRLIELWTCSGSSTQKWQHSPGTTLVNAGTGKCLDDPYLKIRPGQELYAWRCDGTTTQNWTLPS